MTTNDISRLWNEIQTLRKDRHDLSQRVQKLFSDFDGHLTLCTQRHGEINGKLDTILSAVKWAATLVIGILLGLVAFFLKRALFP